MLGKYLEKAIPAIDSFFNTPNAGYKNIRSDFSMISELLPYTYYDENEEVYYNHHSIACLIEINPLLGASDENMNILTNMICDGLPEESVIQFINVASPEILSLMNKWTNIRKRVGGIYSDLAQKRYNYFEKSAIDELFDVPFITRDFKIYASISLPLGKNNEKQLSVLNTVRKSFISTLKTLGAESKGVLPEDLIKFLGNILNIGLKEHSKPTSYSKLDPLNIQIASPEANIEVEDKKLILNEKFQVRTLSPIQYPEIWFQAQNADLLGDFFNIQKQIPCPFIISYAFKIVNQSKAKSRSNYKMVRSQQMAKGGLTSYSRVPRETAMDWSFVTDKISQGQKVVKSSFRLSLFISNSKNIDYYEQKARDLFKANGFIMATERYVQLVNFLSVLPMIPGDGMIDDLISLGKSNTQVSWTCSNLLPLQGDFKGNDPDCIGMPFFSRRGQLWFWNPFLNQEGNYNVAVVGKSGSGKSFAMQEIVSTIMGLGGKMVVLDDGYSFEKSIKLQGGQFVTFNSQNKICVNPFSLIDESKFLNDSDYKEDSILLLKNIVKQMAHQEEPCSDFESSIIEQAVIEAWERNKSKTTITHVSEILLNEDDKRCQDLGRMLSPYTKNGVYKDYFEGKANLEINNTLTGFEFSEIKNRKELQRVVLMVVMFLVTEMMYKGDRKTPISLLIDEAWSLLSGCAMAEFIEGVARRARKYNGNLITGTQSINDYYKNPAAQAAIENTDWIFFMAQKPDAIEKINQMGNVNFSDYQLKVLKSLTKTDNYSECCIYGPGIFSVGRIIIDPFSIILYSSKAEHYAYVKSKEKEGYSLNEAIQITADQFFGKK